MNHSEDRTGTTSLEARESADAATPVQVRRAAMDLLARREHSLLELERKLQRRFPRHLIQTSLEKLAAEGLQSNERFAESYVRQRAGRGYGPMRIRGELQERGIEDIQAEEALEGSGFDWQEVAHQALAKKFTAASTPPSSSLSPAEKARILRFAAYRGFSRDHLPHWLR